MAGAGSGLSDIRHASGIVLVDELGSYLHPRWKMQITGTLREEFPSMQFLVTTHEPLCLRKLLEREVVRVKPSEPDEEGRWRSEFETLEESPSRFRVDQLLTSSFFGLDTTIDPDVEKEFAKYYALLRKPVLTEAEETTREKPVPACPQKGSSATPRATSWSTTRSTGSWPRAQGKDPKGAPGTRRGPQECRRHLEQRRGSPRARPEAMIRVARNGVVVPLSLDKGGKTEEKAVITALDAHLTQVPPSDKRFSFTFKAYKKDDVKKALGPALPREVRLLRVAVRRHAADGRRALAAQGRRRRARPARGSPWAIPGWRRDGKTSCPRASTATGLGCSTTT